MVITWVLGWKATRTFIFYDEWTFLVSGVAAVTQLVFFAKKVTPRGNTNFVFFFFFFLIFRFGTGMWPNEPALGHAFGAVAMRAELGASPSTCSAGRGRYKRCSAALSGHYKPRSAALLGFYKQCSSCTMPLSTMCGSRREGARGCSGRDRGTAGMCMLSARPRFRVFLFATALQRRGKSRSN